MKIALASKSAIKRETVKIAFDLEDESCIESFSAPSTVNEQPIDDETIEGARARIDFIKAACPDADFFISIENGLFLENSQYVDRAVVIIEDKQASQAIALSDGVVFPLFSVYKTQYRDGGFKKWTVGKTMAEDGIVKNDADPHLCLSGKPRAYYLSQAVQKALLELK